MAGPMAQRPGEDCGDSIRLSFNQSVAEKVTALALVKSSQSKLFIRSMAAFKRAGIVGPIHSTVGQWITVRQSFV